MRIRLLVVLAVVLFSTPCRASHPDTQSEIDKLKLRIRALEANLGEQEREDVPFTLFAADKHLELGGLLELEAFYSRQDGADAESDLVLATAELSVNVEIDNYVGGHVIFLYEESPDEDAVSVDEAVISLHCPQTVMGQTVALYGGKLYVPFGHFASFMVTDPLAVDLGETRNTALVIGLEGDFWTLHAAAFNGEVQPDSTRDAVDSYVASIKITPLQGVAFGASWLSDLAESDAGLVGDANLYGDRVPAASGFVSVDSGSFAMAAELVTALEDFSPALVGPTDLTGRKPQTWSIELAWLPLDGLQIAGRYEEAEDYLDDPVRYGATVSYGLFDDTVLALEYLETAPATGADSYAVTGQLALEF